LHANARLPCAGPLQGLLSIEVIVVKKINILFTFLNVNKLAVNKLEVPYSVHCAECQQFYLTTCLWAQAIWAQAKPETEHAARYIFYWMEHTAR